MAVVSALKASVGVLGGGGASGAVVTNTLEVVDGATDIGADSAAVVETMVVGMAVVGN